MMDARREVVFSVSAKEGDVFAALASTVREATKGELVSLAAPSALGPELAKWSAFTGNPVVESTPIAGGKTRYLIRKGALPADPEDALERATRLWMYTNFDCNLACDYCCVRSRPGAPRRALGHMEVARIAGEAASLGYRKILLTGGEPFLLPGIDLIAGAAAAELPTVVLTNAMLFQGPRRAALERLPRDRVTLQVSLDSPTPGLHDAHRGRGSWVRAHEGIAIALSLGFRVRVAATCADESARTEMERFLEAEGVAKEDCLVRPIARRGKATAGVALARQELQPELTVTGQGVYWHPVGADDEDFLVTKEPFPLSEAVRAMRELQQRDRELGERVAEVFRCA